MRYPIIVLVQPVGPNTDPDAYEDVNFVEDKAKMSKLWDEYLALKGILEEFGFYQRQHGDMTCKFPIEACNYDGSLRGNIYHISRQDLALLQGKVTEPIALRESAMAKLTPEEQRALGLFHKKPKGSRPHGQDFDY